MYVAALMGNQEAMELLMKAKARLDEPNPVGRTPSMAAAAADQWPATLWLLNHGSSPWVTSKAGLTLGGYANDSRLKPDSAEGQARDQVISRLVKSGFPWPPPAPPRVREAMANGKWPPSPK
jgi:hypothetical protein